MPFYAWQGIGLDGQVRQGRLYATSLPELEQRLLQRELGLIKAVDLGIITLAQLKTPDQRQRRLFFRELVVLLTAGIRLPQALNFLADQLTNERLQLVVLVIAHAVHQGQKLSQALAQFPKFCTPLILQLVQAGETAHDLTQALDYLAQYLEKQAEFRTQLWAALLVPAITLGVFGVISLFIFIVIMPTFVTIFAAAGQSLTGPVRAILQISTWLRSLKLYWLLAGLVGLAGLWHGLHVTRWGRPWWHRVCLRLPGVRRLMITWSLCSFWQTIALLVRGQVPLPVAWHQASLVVSNTVLQARLQAMAVGLQQGLNLGRLAHQAELFLPEVVVMLGAGLETGQLGAMTSRIVALYEQRLQQLLKLILSGLQPTLVIILGLLIALLIFVVYVPLFELPNMVRF